MSGAATAQVRKVEDAVLLAAAAEARHMRDLLQRVGLAAYGGNYESVRERLRRLGALEERFQPRARLAVPVADLRAAVEGASSLAAVLRALGLPVTRSAYRQLHRRLLQEGVDASALDGRGWRAGRQDLARRSLEQLMVAGQRADVGNLKRRLLGEGVLDRCCAECGVREWRGRPAPLELDHISGDRRDNRLENLRLLCPHCHAQTPTYRGRNIGRVDLLAAVQCEPA